jgi:hypothetical protein
MIEELIAILNDFNCVGLSDLDNVRFMNRIDTKFILPVGQVPDLLEIMKGNYNVLEINGSKILGYHTTYFDTTDYLFFNQHVTGRAERNKVRIRYYLSTGTTFLEVKRRTKKNRTIKWRIERHNSDLPFDERAINFLTSYVPDVAGDLKPTLFNDFSRITFAGIRNPERVTIDLNLSFKTTDGDIWEIPYLAIAELKSDGIAYRSDFGKLTRQLSNHPAGFSKYCLGNALLLDIPRKNILKSKLLLLNKLENDYKSSLHA